MTSDVMELAAKPSFDPPLEKLVTYQSKERRLVGRLLAYWHHLCRGRTYPRLKDIDPSEIGDDWRWAFLLDTARYHDFPNFKYLGPDIARYSGVFLSGEDAFTTTLLDMATHNLERVFKEGCPLLMEEDVSLYDGKRLMYRAVLLPLSDDGSKINYVLGAANGRMDDS